jgi:hypothetical protein
MSGSLFPEFFAQCCDAGYFLDLGKECAIKDVCYGAVRPGGAYYWFSWPVTLGLSNNAFIYANLFLLTLSSLLATFAMHSIAKCSHSAFSKADNFSKTLFFFAILAIHLVFFWPTLFTSLSDPPAALFLLNGLWMLLLSCSLGGIKKLLLLSLGGLFLGWAAWIRAFYFYPVLMGVAAGFIIILISPRRNFMQIFLLCALIFPAIQLIHSYKESGKLAYLNSSQSNAWTSIHLSSDAIGYDTVFQNQGYYSPPHYCSIKAGFLISLQNNDYASLFCLIANRASFYLATYRPVTFIYPSVKNKLFTEAIEDIGNSDSWFMHNLVWHPNVAADPNGGVTADKMSVLSASPLVGAYVSQWVALPGDTDYTFSVWLWSDTPTEIRIAFTRHSDDKTIASNLVTLTGQPQRFSVSGKTLNFDEYSVMIGAPPSSLPVTFGSSSSDALYAWGAQLEEGTDMTSYAGAEPLVASDIRDWYPLLLIANSLAILLALLLIVRARKILLFDPSGFAITVIIGAVFAEALVIIPEQRFCVAFMVAVWVFMSGYILSILKKPSKQPTSVNP